MAKETDVIGQQFARETTSDVTREMIRAGTRGESRIAAGVRAAWAAKTGSMYGRDTTKMARLLRLFGQQNTAKWYDRFFATEKMKAQRSSRKESGDGEGVSDARQTAQVKLNTGLLKAQNKRIDNIHGLLDVVASDVLTIKTIVTPRSSPMKVGGLANQYNEKAQAKANATETAKLVLKVVEEEKARVELRKKFAWKDKPEKEDKETDVEKLGKKIDHLGIALGQMKKMRGGFLSGILGSLLSSFLVRAALIGMAGYIGVKIGQWLDENLKISQRLGDFFDDVKRRLGLGGPEPDAGIDTQKLLDDNNKRLEGTGWKALGAGKWEKDGQQYDWSELSEETKALMKERRVFDQTKYLDHYDKERAKWDKERGINQTGGATGSWGDEEPSAPSTETGTLRSDKRDKYSDLADLVSRGEGTSDERAREEGYASGYDTTLDYGKWGNTWNGKPVSQLNLSEVRSLQESMLEKQHAAGVPRGQGSTALGKYQFIKTNLFGGKTADGGYDVGLLSRNNIGLSEKFDAAMQERLFRIRVEERRKESIRLNNGKYSDEAFQESLSAEWASLAKDESDKGYYRGQRATVKSAEIQPVLQNMGKPLDEGSRENQKNNSPASVTVVAPQQQTVVNNMPNPAPSRPVSKASPLSTEPSFLRGALGDIPHPTNLR